MVSGPITSLSARELARLIRQGELSARETVEAHLQRIEQVNARLNAVVVPMFDEARRTARVLDEAQTQGQPLGPLHGVPVTIKEMFDVAGTPTTGGITGRAAQLAAEDAPLVQRLRRAGAIILGKTNVPQLGAFFECDNPLYGRTNNPWNLARAPGGSSGGEAAIIAAGGSPLGLGSDGGGSIRQPSHSCGICGLKPTSGKLSLAGHFHSPNWSSDWIQPGPMARCVADLGLALDILSDANGRGNERGAAFRTKHQNDSSSVEGMRIAVYKDDGFFRPSPAVRRAVEEAAEGLRKRGAVMEEFRPPEIMEAWRIYFGLFLADGLSHWRRVLSSSKTDWRIRRTLWGAALPSFTRPILAWLFECFGQKHLSPRWCLRRTLSELEIRQLLDEQERYRSRFYRALREKELEAILCPVHALPSTTHGCYYTGFWASYSLLYNLLGMPAGVVPATRVRPGEESDRPGSLDVVERAATAVERMSAGLPVGVQVAGLPEGEQIVLRVMAALEEHFHGQADFPVLRPDSI